MKDVDAAMALGAGDAGGMMSGLHPAAPEWADRAEGCRMRLDALHAPTERALLDLGERLRQAHDTSRQLTGMANALNQRLADAEFQRVLRELDGTVRLVEALRRGKSDRSDRLERVVTTANAIRRALDGLLQTMTHVNVLGVNAKIEAAHMVDSGIDFSLFTHEIVRLAARGRGSIEEVGRELAALSGAVMEADALQRDFDRAHLTELNEVGDRLATSLAAMRQRERAATEALGRLPVMLDQTAGRIGAVVNGLQFGDISRQRLEHVETALAMLAAVAAGRQPLPAVDGATVPVFAAAVCDLQMRQLAQVRDEFDGRIAGVLDNLRQLAVSVADIGRQTSVVYSDGADGGSTFLMAIDKELERVAAMIAHYRDAHDRTEASLARVTAAVGRMAKWMEAITEVDAEMSLIGLNASIKCGNLGFKGRALNVVAQELRSFARQTRGHAGAIADCLAVVTTISDEITAGHGDEERTRLADMQHYLDDAVEQLRQCGGETAWVLSQIQERSRGMVAAIDDAVHRFQAREAHRRAVDDTLADLRALAAAALADIPEGGLQAKAHMLAFMEAHYTMDSERGVHGGAIGRHDTAAAPAAADLDDILF